MFDKKRFSELILKAIGDMSISKYAVISGIDRSYLSLLINQRRENPPSVEIIKKLAENATNNVTFNSLMRAAGYINDDDISIALREKLIDGWHIEIIGSTEKMLFKGIAIKDSEKKVAENISIIGLVTELFK